MKPLCTCDSPECRRDHDDPADTRSPLLPDLIMEYWQNIAERGTNIVSMPERLDIPNTRAWFRETIENHWAARSELFAPPAFPTAAAIDADTLAGLEEDARLGRWR